MRVLPFVSLLVFLAATMPVVYALPSIGVSHHNTEAIIYIGETKEFPVGRIYNTGDVVLNASCNWIPDGNCSLTVKVKPESYLLKPEDSFQVIVVVESPSEEQIGNYSGIVEVLCKPLNITGNPVSPAGSLQIKICVLPLTDQAESAGKETGGTTFNYGLVVIACLALGSIAVSAVWFKRNKKPIKKVAPTRFLLFHY